MLYDTSKVLQIFVIKKQILQKLVIYYKIIYKHLVMNGEDIKKRRKELGLSQTDLGKRVGVSTNTVSTWENGGAIPGTTLDRLKDVLYGKVESNDKTDRLSSLKAEIYQATNNLIDILNEQIAEAKKDTSSLKSIEELQQLLKLKLELVEQLKQSME